MRPPGCCDKGRRVNALFFSSVNQSAFSAVLRHNQQVRVVVGCDLAVSKLTTTPLESKSFMTGVGSMRHSAQFARGEGGFMLNKS